LDVITDFTPGASSDVLNLSAFITTATTLSTITSTTAITTAANNGVYVLQVGAAIAAKAYGSSGADFADLFASSGAGKISTTTASGAKFAVLVQGTDVSRLFFVDAGASDTTIASSEVVEVATLTGVSTSSTAFVIGNFG